MKVPDEGSSEPRPAGPVADDGGALRAGSSSTPPSSAPPAGGADGETVERDLDALLADAEAKKDEYLELAKRTQADFENFRKRITADIQAASSRGKAELARELIDPVDNLERALVAKGVDPEIEPPDDDSSGDDGQDEFVKGVNFVFRGLCETLRRHGIEVVNPKGEKFDPTVHEALSTQPVEGVDSGIVVEVMQKGYRMGDQLIRPARVVVSA